MRFRHIYIEITNVCNLSCSFCPGTSRKTMFMPLDKFERILKQVKPFTERIYLHVMGEPLLHPEFSGIIKACADHSVPAAVTTNGSQFNKPNAESLFNPVLRQLNISLHSLYSSCPQKEQEERLEKIFMFTKQAFIRHPELYISYRLWNLVTSNENLKSEQNEWICKKISEAFNVEIPNTGHSSGRKSRCLLNRLYLHLDTCFEWPEIKEEKFLKTNGFCHGLGAHAAILADGSVVPCCLDRNGTMALGNCFDEPFENIIRSTRADAIHNGFQNGKLIEKLCRSCAFCKRFEKSFIKKQSAPAD